MLKKIFAGLMVLVVMLLAWATLPGEYGLPGLPPGRVMAMAAKLSGDLPAAGLRHHFSNGQSESGLPESGLPESGLPENSQRPNLTLAMLDQRLSAPVRQEGAQMISLQGVTIDLRAASDSEVDSKGGSAFAAQFYQRLNKRLNGPQPLGLDLSRSLIQGNLDLSRLALRVPAYGSAGLPALAQFNQAQFNQAQFNQAQSNQVLGPTPQATGLVSGASGALAQSFLIQPQPLELDTFAFQGPLLVNQTCFNGDVDGSTVYFLDRVEATQAMFARQANWRGARFARSADFSRGRFQQETSFRAALFASRTRFDQVTFLGPTDWQGARFRGSVRFAQARFQDANFARSHWQTNADFDRARFHRPVNFQKSRFDQALFLTDAQFDGIATFRQAQFLSSLSLRGAHILSQIDFGDAQFAADSLINVADLEFNAEEAKILGSPGQMGHLFSVPVLTGNETVLRNLVRNFRLLEQIADANQVEYTAEQLRLSQIRRQIFGVSLNQAAAADLEKVGFSPEQAQAVVQWAQPWVSRTDLLTLDEIDLATYLRVRDRITTQATTFMSQSRRLFQWLMLAALLGLSHYGTNVGLAFSVGLVATTIFAIIFWWLDRYRRRYPAPIVPTRTEAISVGLGSLGSMAIALLILSQSSDHPFNTLAVVAVLTLPVPMGLVARIYQQGRYHDLMEQSYFVRNGATRRLQVLIARLPIIPEYPFYCDRYQPLPTDRGWNWLSYFDFSFNNWFKFGFHDIRLRDKAVPGLISTLVWYQWSLGILYIALLLWTLSRTIPGLNLLLYF